MPTWAQPPLPARLANPGREPFVGRRREIEALEEVWEHVENGRRRAVFIGGEPGSGKSRLAAETARALHRQGVAVLLGSATRDQGYPYQPMVESLDHLLLGTEPGTLAELIPDDSAELVRITTNVRRHRDDLPDPEPSEHEYRLELFDAYAGLIARLVESRPIAMILEDLHWASAPTRHLLAHMVHAVDDGPLLVIGTMRNTAPDRSDDLSLVIADLYSLPGVTRVDLGGLETADIEVYLTAQGERRSMSLSKAAMLLREQTGGNPLFLNELWGEISKDGGIEAALRSGELHPTNTVRDSLERRLRLLGEDSIETLEMASIIGDMFRVRDLAEARRRDVHDVLADLDDAFAFGFVKQASDKGTFEFNHALVRHTVLERIAPSRLANLHLRLAESLEPQYEFNPHLAPLLARLFAGAGALTDAPRLSFYNAEAARHAERSLAHEEAATYWERAASTAADSQVSEEMLMCAAHSHLLAGDFPDARRLYVRVFESDDPRVALRAAIGFEDSSWRPGLNGQPAVEMLEDALAGIQDDPSDGLYVRALSALGRAQTFAGNLSDAEPLTKSALEFARSMGDDSLIASALHAILHRYWSVPGPDEFAVQASRELREIGIRSRRYDLLGPSGAYTAYSAYMSGDIEGWREGWKDLKLAVAKTGQPFWEWVDGCYQHCDYFMKGEFSLAERSAEENRELGFAFGSDETDGPYGIQMYMVRRETGALEQIRPLVESEGSNQGHWAPGLLSLYTELEMREPAEHLFWVLTEGIRDIHRKTAVWPALITFMTEAAIFLNDPDVFSAVEPFMAEYRGFNLPMGQGVAVFGSADRYLAEIARGLGQFDEAQALFMSALALDVKTGSIVHQAETMARLASFMREIRGNEAEASRYEARSRALAEPRNHARVLRMLAGPEPIDDLPDGLTPREIDVLRLLVAGASNRDIGEKLHISGNTAANHVRSILIKTGSPNRTAAAIYATEKGLA